MNAFARSNLSVAMLRLVEARATLEALPNMRTKTDAERDAFWRKSGAADWCVREAMRLIEAACGLEEMASADTLPAPDSETRKVGG